MRLVRSRRESFNWLRLLVVGTLAVLGVAVLWSSLQYSTAKRPGASVGGVKQVPPPPRPRSIHDHQII